MSLENNIDPDGEGGVRGFIKGLLSQKLSEPVSLGQLTTAEQIAFMEVEEAARISTEAHNRAKALSEVFWNKLKLDRNILYPCGLEIDKDNMNLMVQRPA